jgi:diaminohydroxyphosphoribosylaminopyrimidine deaminase/5-amino-6-(5-phosphoribosylamino)uracil reductase
MDERDYMKRAIRLARRGAGRVEPNPMVGCVLVRGGEIVGEGWHRRFGEAHAEVEALRDAGERARGATAFVTLEPCNHHGKQPPCSEALIDAGVQRVVIGCLDPHPRGPGSVDRLTAAGVAVDVGACGEEAAELIAPFTKLVTTGLPWTIGKWAATVDGAIATAARDSRWISNERSRKLVHRLRARVDAILVGIGTVKADDPQLTARGVQLRRRARRVVVDPRFELTERSRLVQTLDAAPLTVASAGDALAEKADLRQRLEAREVEFVELPWLDDARRRLDLRLLLEHLGHRYEATNVLVEGGAGLHASFAAQGLLDELLVFIAPKLLGDGRGLPPLAETGGPGVERIANAQALHLAQVRRLGDDVMLRYRTP